MNFNLDEIENNHLTTLQCVGKEFTSKSYNWNQQQDRQKKFGPVSLIIESSSNGPEMVGSWSVLFAYKELTLLSYVLHVMLHVKEKTLSTQDNQEMGKIPKCEEFA